MSDASIVIDASAAIALIRREPAAPAIKENLHRHARLLVPEAFWLELVNVLVRRYGVAPNDVVEGLREIDGLGIVTVPIERPALLVTVELQTRFGLSAYDAAYLALAEIENVKLLTLDRRLNAAAGPRAVGLPGLPKHRLGETPAPYGERVDWARFGSYLAELRAAARAAATRT